jgi:16S rRNA (uracil1498-N3)-methyltransferase
MRLTRVCLAQPLAAGATVVADDRVTAHLTRVLRLSGGAPLRVFDGAGTEHAATLGARRGAQVEIRIGERVAPRAESPLAITLVQGVSRGERMDYTIQKATELGARRLVPVLAGRSVVRLDAAQAARRLEHWRAVALAACEQCGRAQLPEIAAPRSLAEHLAAPAATATGGALRLLLMPDGEQCLAALPASLAAVELLIGPEGGLSEAEQQLARRAGFAGLRLGPRVLRTETAATAAIAALQVLRGDLG